MGHCGYRRIARWWAWRRENFLHLSCPKTGSATEKRWMGKCILDLSQLSKSTSPRAQQRLFANWELIIIYFCYVLFLTISMTQIGNILKFWGEYLLKGLTIPFLSGFVFFFDYPLTSCKRHLMCTQAVISVTQTLKMRKHNLENKTAALNRWHVHTINWAGSECHALLCHLSSWCNEWLF